MRKLSNIIALLFLVSCLCVAAQNEITLVSNGKSKAAIITAANPTVETVQASRILSEHLLQITGAKLKVYSEKDVGKINSLAEGITVEGLPEFDYFILIGESDLTHSLGLSTNDLGLGGIKIKTIGNIIALMGHDSKDQPGTVYAVTTFLQEYIGVFYLWPGELGKVVPKKATIIIPPISINYSSSISERHIRYAPYMPHIRTGLEYLDLPESEFLNAYQNAMATTSYDGGWFTWHRQASALPIPGHAFGYLWNKYGEEHLEWFALQPNGSRYPLDNGSRARLCKSNPELIDAIVADLIEKKTQDPSLKYLSISPNDGSVNTFCMCDACKAMDHPDGRRIRLTGEIEPGVYKSFDYVSLTDRIVKFSNAIAEKFSALYPDVLLVCDIYSVYSAPPIGVTAHPNLIFRLVAPSYDNDNLRQQGLNDWPEWSKKISNVLWRPNLLFGRTADLVVTNYSRKIAEDMGIFSEICEATDFDGGMLNHWSTHGLNYYILARLQWNPELDYEDILDEYCKAGFGKAWETIKQYFLKLEELTDEYMEKGDVSNVGKYSLLGSVYSDAVIDELLELLDTACILAKEDSDYDGKIGKRIYFLKKGVEFSKIQSNLHTLLARANRGQPFDQNLANQLLSKRYLMMKEILLSDYHLAVNGTVVVRREGSRMQILGWDGVIADPDADEHGEWNN